MFTAARTTFVRRILPRLLVLGVIAYLVVGMFSSQAGKVNEIKDAAQLSLRIATGSPVLVDFTASWCMPCKMMAPELEKAAAANKNVEFYKIDIDKHQDIAKDHKVTTVPAVFFYHRGKQTGKFGGSRDAIFIQEFINESMTKTDL